MRRGCTLVLPWVVTLAWTQWVWAQGCCTPGSSPLGGVSGAPLSAGSIECGYALDGFELDQGYEGSRPIDDPGGRFSRVLSHTFFARVGLHPRIAAVVELPVEYRMREQDLRTPTRTRRVRFSNTAIGDLTTLVMARLWPFHLPGPAALNLGLGLKWPAGPDDSTQDGLTLPIELQTGTGTVDLLAALAASRSFRRGAVQLAAVGRLPTRADSGYRYGTELNLALLGDWFAGPVRLGPELRARLAGTNDFRGREVLNTGGWRIMAGLHVAKELPNLGLAFEGTYLLPAWRHLNGLQLGVSQQFRVGIRWAVL